MEVIGVSSEGAGAGLARAAIEAAQASGAGLRLRTHEQCSRDRSALGSFTLPLRQSELVDSVSLRASRYVRLVPAERHLPSAASALAVRDSPAPGATKEKRPHKRPFPFVVPGTGLEPAHLSAPDPKSGVSTNSTTRA